MTALTQSAKSLRVFASDVADGFFEITHNGLALLGVALVFFVITLAARPDLRQVGEEKLTGWLQSRQIVSADIDPTLVLHLSDPAAMQAFIDRQRVKGQVTSELRVDWKLEADWVWVHLAFAPHGDTSDWPKKPCRKPSTM